MTIFNYEPIHEVQDPINGLQDMQYALFRMLCQVSDPLPTQVFISGDQRSSPLCASAEDEHHLFDNRFRDLMFIAVGPQIGHSYSLPLQYEPTVLHWKVTAFTNKLVIPFFIPLPLPGPLPQTCKPNHRSPAAQHTSPTSLLSQCLLD
jgi:hypothetical protein